MITAVVCALATIAAAVFFAYVAQRSMDDLYGDDEEDDDDLPES